MSRRTSIYINEFKHKNPIPNAAVINGVLMSGLILGRDATTGGLPPGLVDQCANMFGHMKKIAETAGGGIDDILKVTIWMNDRKQRDAINGLWLDMFPDESSRPARLTLQTELEGGVQIQCDFTAILSLPDRWT